MRTSKTLSICLAHGPVQTRRGVGQKGKPHVERAHPEALRHYEQKQRAPINYDLIAALRGVQESAKRAGLDKLTEREIGAEVIAHRRERDKKTKSAAK